MHFSKNKTEAILIAAILTISIGASTTLIPRASAHTPPWNIPTYAYISVAPNPIGVGQSLLVYFWLDPVYGAFGGSSTSSSQPGNGSTSSSALLANNYRFQNYELTITSPNGTPTTTTFPVISDPTSAQSYHFTPTTVGTYTLNFTYPGQVYGAKGNGYEKSSIYGDTYDASSASTTLTVQSTPIPTAITSEPLPTNYWSYPIYGENTNWYTISSNWLGSGSPVPEDGTWSGSGPLGQAFTYQMYHTDAVGPLTAHIMWMKPLDFGGIVGGNEFSSSQGAMYFEGSSYQPRFVNPIIIAGYLYYTEPVAFTGPSSGPTVCVNLQTGQVLWSSTAVPPISFGYLYNLWNPDQHGAYPPILFTANFARAFDAYTGEQLFNVTGVPTGTAVTGPSGEQIRYVLTNDGTTANPAWYLSQWNSSKLWIYDINPFTGGGSLSPSLLNASAAVGTGANPGMLPSSALISTNPYQPTSASYINAITINANIPINATTLGLNGIYDQAITTYDWNISIPWRNTMTPSPTVEAANYGDIMLCENGTLPSGFAATQTVTSSAPYTMFAVNLNASNGAIGSILWTQTYPAPPGNITLQNCDIDFQTRVFAWQYYETMQWVGFSLNNGDPMWGPTPEQVAFNYYDWSGYDPGVMAYGNLYNGGFGGVTYCFNDKTGALEWTWGNGPPGSDNSTYTNLTPYGDYPTFIQSVANGVVYLSAEEHTIPDPLYKGANMEALNATTGQEIPGTVLSEYDSTWASSGSEYIVADGYAAFMNGYDNMVEVTGQGSSATTIQAPLTAITAGNGVVIQGTVMDTSAGTQQPTVKADFPNGVPVCSDAIMGAWMGYVYQQQAAPTSFTGVTVTLTAIDPNGNFITLGTATTNQYGVFDLTWNTPSIPGTYDVTATFAGTNGYWGSSAYTGMDVQGPSATTAPTSTPVSGLATMSGLTIGIAVAVIAIIIAIAIVGLLLLRKKP